MNALPLLGAAFAAALAVGQPDPAGDVRGGHGPDIVAVAVSSTRTTVTFRVRFASAPPLGVNSKERWVDLILIAVDVPPFGPPPAVPGGPWAGANFALEPRSALGSPASLRYSVAAAREAVDEAAGGVDLVPDRGTAFVRLAA